MSSGELIGIMKDAVFTALMMAAPFLVVSVVIGILISIFQAATQINEQNITFVPKILATALLLIFLSSWLINVISDFTNRLFTNINSYL